MSREPSGPWVAPMEKAGATNPRNGRPSWNRLAEIAEVSTTTITQMVDGPRKTSPATIAKVATALRVRPEDVSAWLELDREVRARWNPPPEADLLTDRQREAISELIRSFTATRERGEGHARPAATRTPDADPAKQAATVTPIRPAANDPGADQQEPGAPED